MLVCAHGDVSAYCNAHGFTITEEYSGDITDYSGTVRVIVTDQELTKDAFYELKLNMLTRGYEVISTRHDDENLARFVEYLSDSRIRKNKAIYGGRQIFGYYRRAGEVYPREESLAVVYRILELRDSGHTYQQIQNNEEVHHPDGRKLSISTIQQIIRNRKIYEERRCNNG